LKSIAITGRIIVLERIITWMSIHFDSIVVPPKSEGYFFIGLLSNRFSLCPQTV